MILYENYHKHTHFSNIFTPDSAVTVKDYVKRCLELGHKVLSSMEHGFQGRYYEVYELAKKNDLKFIFGAEAYWVKDRHEKDNTNAHICLFAKTEKGRREINRILSDANIDGYYYKPRVDLDLLLSLTPSEVFITTACVAFWHYEDIEDIVLQLHNHFKESMMLEVQYHNTPSQKTLNQRILRLSNTYGIEMIMGCDSHYITPDQHQGRADVLEAKGIRYDEEDGWFMDYPDGDTAFQRFIDQKILSKQQILRAMENTHIFLGFDNLEFNKDIKLPTLYPDKTQAEKDKIYIDIILKEWKEFSKTIPVEAHAMYKAEIQKEVRTIINTKMADYFLIDHEIVKEAQKMGGIITNTGRGSGVSYFTNTLLGFSKVDRISSPVKLYPERFISESRILETKSLPDLDLNCGNPEIFALAQTKVLGEGHSYPMIAFGTFKKLSAFKLYAKSQKLSFDLANEITKQIEKYEDEYKYADDDEKDLIDIYDFIEPEYHHIYAGSEKYTGIIASKSPHPCGYLIYQGNIKEELGLMLVKSESTKKETLVTVIDGGIAEEYKFLKNDLLKVDVVLLTDLIYKRIGVKPHTVNELLDLVRNDEKVWDIYKNGWTMGINQCEKLSTTNKVKRYQPRNPSELTAFIAGIRPSFKSMYSIFESREPFSYGIHSFDDIIVTEEMPNSFVLYQEQTMATLAYAGFSVDETYGIIKAISKKKPAVVKPLQERFIKGFTEKIMANEKVTYEEALEMSQRVWQIVEDSSGYGFNASHAYSYALDSLYCAYLKAYYPMEFYEVMLEVYSDKGNKKKVSKFKQEMEQAFDIKVGELKFGKNNKGFVVDMEANTINESMLSVKYLNQQCSEDLYILGQNQYESFTDVLMDVAYKTGVNARQLSILIKLNYFSAFGNNKKLLDFVEWFNVFYKAKTINKEKYADNQFILDTITAHSKQTDKQFKELDNVQILKKIWDTIENKKIKLSEQAGFEAEYLGYVQVKEPAISKDFYIVVEMKFSKNKLRPFLTLHNVMSGKTVVMRIKDDKLFAERKFKEFDVLKLNNFAPERKSKRINGKYVTISETELVISSYFVV
jgi:DNA polymerase III alpha subunit